MSAVSVQELLEAGVHFGHRVSRWNPRMAPYIHGRRNSIHILNLVETVKGLARACHFLRELAATGRQIVLVGTKRQIKNVVFGEAERCSMPYVNERWLGGTLTNFSTIRSRLKRLEELEALASSGQLENYKKKEQSSLMREMRRIKKNLEGIRGLERMPGAILVVDPNKEYIAVREANRLGLPIVAILDTDCDPTQVDIPIPANDDAMKSVSLILAKLADAITEGRANYREGVLPVEEEEQVIEMKKREQKGTRRPQHRGGPGRRSGAPRGGESRGPRREGEPGVATEEAASASDAAAPAPTETVLPAETGGAVDAPPAADGAQG